MTDENSLYIENTKSRINSERSLGRQSTPLKPGYHESQIGGISKIGTNEKKATNRKTKEFEPIHTPTSVLPYYARIIVIRNGMDKNVFKMHHRLCRIGRSAESHIRIQRPNVSNDHAEITIDKETGNASIQQFNNSGIGVFINQVPLPWTDIRLKETLPKFPIHNKDILNIDGREFRIEFPRKQDHIGMSSKNEGVSKILTPLRVLQQMYQESPSIATRQDSMSAPTPLKSQLHASPLQASILQSTKTLAKDSPKRSLLGSPHRDLRLHTPPSLGSPLRRIAQTVTKKGDQTPLSGGENSATASPRSIRNLDTSHVTESYCPLKRALLYSANAGMEASNKLDGCATPVNPSIFDSHINAVAKTPVPEEPSIAMDGATMMSVPKDPQLERTPAQKYKNDTPQTPNTMQQLFAGTDTPITIKPYPAENPVDPMSLSRQLTSRKLTPLRTMMTTNKSPRISTPRSDKHRVTFFTVEDYTLLHAELPFPIMESEGDLHSPECLSAPKNTEVHGIIEAHGHSSKIEMEFPTTDHLKELPFFDQSSINFFEERRLETDHQSDEKIYVNDFVEPKDTDMPLENMDPVILADKEDPQPDIENVHTMSFEDSDANVSTICNASMNGLVDKIDPIGDGNPDEDNDTNVTEHLFIDAELSLIMSEEQALSDHMMEEDERYMFSLPEEKANDSIYQSNIISIKEVLDSSPFVDIIQIDLPGVSSNTPGHEEICKEAIALDSAILEAPLKNLIKAETQTDNIFPKNDHFEKAIHASTVFMQNAIQSADQHYFNSSICNEDNNYSTMHINDQNLSSLENIPYSVNIVPLKEPASVQNQAQGPCISQMEVVEKTEEISLRSKLVESDIIMNGPTLLSHSAKLPDSHALSPGNSFNCPSLSQGPDVQIGEKIVHSVAKNDEILVKESIYNKVNENDPSPLSLNVGIALDSNDPCEVTGEALLAKDVFTGGNKITVSEERVEVIEDLNVQGEQALPQSDSGQKIENNDTEKQSNFEVKFVADPCSEFASSNIQSSMESVLSREMQSPTIDNTQTDLLEEKEKDHERMEISTNPPSQDLHMDNIVDEFALNPSSGNSGDTDFDTESNPERLEKIQSEVIKEVPLTEPLLSPLSKSSLELENLWNTEEIMNQPSSQMGNEDENPPAPQCQSPKSPVNPRRTNRRAVSTVVEKQPQESKSAENMSTSRKNKATPSARKRALSLNHTNASELHEGKNEKEDNDQLVSLSSKAAKISARSSNRKKGKQQLDAEVDGNSANTGDSVKPEAQPPTLRRSSRLKSS